jgi:hypothetical protein
LRIYKNLYECVSETERNLWEMGIEVPLKTMQNKVVEGDPKLGMTKELMGVTFQILEPLQEIEKAYLHIFKESHPAIINLDWVDAEFKERISEIPINPGEAWKIRRDIWEEFLIEDEFDKPNKYFDYTYSERYSACNQLQRIIEYLKKDRNSRRAILNMFIGPDFTVEQDDSGSFPGDLVGLEKRRRVPCSVTYSWLYRNEKLNIFYHMRSSDFYTHFVNDMQLTALLNQYVSKQIGVEPGILTVYINSLHAYYKDLEERKIF